MKKRYSNCTNWDVIGRLVGGGSEKKAYAYQISANQGPNWRFVFKANICECIYKFAKHEAQIVKAEF